MSATLTAVARLSDEVLLPAAAAVEDSGTIPPSHFDALAELGLFGPFAPTWRGGAGLTPAEVPDVVERVAAGCLATAFVWIQHLGLVGALLDPAAPEVLRQDLLPRLVAGTVRSGVALAGSWPGPARVRAEPADGGWVLDGDAPWVTGWGYLDVVMVVARTPDDDLVTVVVDAVEGPGLVAIPQHLAAVNASRTVSLALTSLFVAGDRVVGRRPHDPVRQQREGLRPNGSLALGLARRCCSLLGPSALDAQLERCRRQLDTADVEAMASARAGASELAVRAAAALTVAEGSAAALAGGHADRSWREAAFLLVFGSRSAIKADLKRRLQHEA